MQDFLSEFESVNSKDQSDKTTQFNDETQLIQQLQRDAGNYQLGTKHTYLIFSFFYHRLKRQCQAGNAQVLITSKFAYNCGTWLFVQSCTR